MGAFFSFFSLGGKPKQTPISGAFTRIKSIIYTHYRGIVGAFCSLLFIIPQLAEDKSNKQVTKVAWMMMTWYFFWQPVNVPVVGLIPIFMFPITGVLKSDDVCKCYFNENLAMLILAFMLGLLLNNSGMDRRIACAILADGGGSQFTANRLILKASTAAFVLSILSNRLMASSILIGYMTPILTAMQSATASYRATEANFDKLGRIINNAISTSSAIGSIVFFHGSYTVIGFRTIFYCCGSEGKEYPDIFNYLQYTAFAFPLAFVMFILNLAYHLVLVNVKKKPITTSSTTEIRKRILKYKEDLPKKVTTHELLTIIFLIITLALFMFRWSSWLSMGWAGFRQMNDYPEYAYVKDATVAAMCLIALSMLPKGFSFLKYATAKKKSQLPACKPESSILWFKFIDKNTNYGYLFVFGGGIALYRASEKTGVAAEITEHLGTYITDHNWNVSILLVCLISVILANIMSGAAACAVFLPFVLSMSQESAANNWHEKRHFGALAVGIGTTLGFMCPFLFTPAYFSHYVGKVPKRKMALYALGSVIICLILLWLALAFWAPIVWDSSIKFINTPVPGKPAGVEPEATEAPAGF